MSSIKIAENLCEKGEYIGSLELVLEVLEKEPDNLRALELKASLCGITGKNSEAIQTYKKLLRFYGSDDKVWTQLYLLNSISTLYWRLSDLDKAISYCEKSIELCERFLDIESPQNEDFIETLIEMVWTLGEYQYKFGKYSCAIDTYKKLLKLFSKFGCLETIADALYELACSYYKLNRTTEALSAYSETLKIRKVLKDSLYTSWTHYYIASIHFSARDFKKALFHVEKCLLLMEKIYLEIAYVSIKDDPLYRRARRLHKSLKVI